MVIPEITVLISKSLPANDNVFTDQDENLAFIFYRNGSQLVKFIFLEFRGTPRYLTGRDHFHSCTCLYGMKFVIH